MAFSLTYDEAILESLCLKLVSVHPKLTLFSKLSLNEKRWKISRDRDHDHHRPLASPLKESFHPEINPGNSIEKGEEERKVKRKRSKKDKSSLQPSKF